MSLQEALAVVKTAGYRVSKPRATRTGPSGLKRPLGLNAVGKPFSPSYDPKYKNNMPLTSIRRLSTPQNNFKWVRS